MIFQKKELEQAVKTAVKVMGNKEVMDACRYIRFTSTENGVLLRSTDFDQTIFYTIEQNTEDFDFAIEGKTLFALLSKISDETVEFGKETKNNKITMKWGKGKTEFRTLNIAMMPEIDKPDFHSFDDFVSFEKSHLLQALQAGQNASQEDKVISSSPTNVMNLQIETNLIESSFRLFATDGKRVAVISGKCQKANLENKEPITINIPLASVKPFIAILKSNESQTINIGQDNKHIYFEINSNLICSFRKSTINYPDVLKLLKGYDFNLQTQFNVSDFVGAMERVAVITTDRDRAIQFEFNEGELILSAKTDGKGEIKDSLECDYDFDDFQTAFDLLYLSPIIRYYSAYGENNDENQEENEKVKGKNLKLQFAKSISEGMDKIIYSHPVQILSEGEIKIQFIIFSLQNIVSKENKENAATATV